MLLYTRHDLTSSEVQPGLDDWGFKFSEGLETKIEICVFCLSKSCWWQIFYDF